MNIHSNQRALSGTEAWGCGLSRAPRMAMWPAAPDIAPYISGYQLYVVGESPEPHRGAFEPSWASIRIAVTEGSDWVLSQAKGEWFAPPPVVLFGPSSKLVWSRSGAGVLVGAGIRPRGWRRLFAEAARDWADRIGPTPVMGGIAPAAIRDLFCALPGDEAVPQAFDALFREVLRPSSSEDEPIGRIEAALVDPEIESVRGLTEATGLSIRRLERLAHRAFGFPPKLLLRRARFLRSLHAIRAARRGEGAMAIDSSYTDYSHFIRDSHDFLGMSPQAFLDIDMPLMKRSLELRKRVLGAPAQALDEAPEAPTAPPLPASRGIAGPVAARAPSGGR